LIPSFPTKKKQPSRSSRVVGLSPPPFFFSNSGRSKRGFAFAPSLSFSSVRAYAWIGFALRGRSCDPGHGCLPPFSPFGSATRTTSFLFLSLDRITAALCVLPRDEFSLIRKLAERFFSSSPPSSLYGLYLIFNHPPFSDNLSPPGGAVRAALHPFSFLATVLERQYSPLPPLSLPFP